VRLFLRSFILTALIQQCLGQTSSRTILAVFAHLDDDVFAGALWAHYAQQGAKVQFVIVAQGTGGGRLGRVPGITTGQELARVYDEEVRCTCRELGIAPPIILRFGDGQLGKPVQPPWANLAEAEHELRGIILNLKPEAIITFGPEGVYGHPEHRLVGALVTQIVQSGAEGVGDRLLYMAFPKSRISEWHETEPFSAVEDRYLTVQVPYSESDLARFKRSFSCFKTQFLPHEMQKLPEELNRVWGGRLYLRPWFGSQKGEDVFGK
jgi:LmbE family N-acetylglucosaminyl deacetylase